MFAQIERILKLNGLVITDDVIETARNTLGIGAVQRRKVPSPAVKDHRHG